MTSKWLVRGLTVAACRLGSGAVLAADLAYKDDPVTNVTSVRTKPGKWFDYLPLLDTRSRPKWRKARRPASS